MTRAVAGSKILPVIDLKQSLVVRGVAGRRDEYQPVVSRLTSEPTPAAVAAAFVIHLHADDVYVADLDALAGAEPDWESLRQIAAAGLKAWLDCGVGSAGRAESLAEYARREGTLVGMIVPLESVSEPDDLPGLLSIVGPEQAVFSLDLKGGQPLFSGPAWQGLAPLDIATLAWHAGFRRMVVVDLAQVGTGDGPSVAPLCHGLHVAYPELELVAGGGVRGPADVKKLAAAGCDRVLVASALHDGRL